MSSTTAIGPAILTMRAALGAGVIPWVGPGADLLSIDSVAVEGVRVSPAAAGVEITLDGVSAEARIEQGVVHGAEIELAEATVGYEERLGRFGIGLGRMHLPITEDRRYENEDLTLSFRPVASRIVLPIHANGVEGRIAWPDRISLLTGAFWATPTVDAPNLWARLDLTPVGALPPREDGSCDGVMLSIGAGGSHRDSPTLGRQDLVSADLTFGLQSFGAALALVHTAQRDPDSTAQMSDDAWLTLHSRLVALRRAGNSHAPDLYGALRVERVSGYIEGEDARLVGLARLSLRTQDAWGTLFIEGSASREQGQGLPAEGDVVALGRAERSNDWFGLGAMLRW